VSANVVICLQRLIRTVNLRKRVSVLLVGESTEMAVVSGQRGSRAFDLLEGWGMFNSQELHHGSSPTPDAYEGSWLELIENPDSDSTARETTNGPEAPAYDVGNGSGSASFGSSD